jgi:hypothetical protein
MWHRTVDCLGVSVDIGTRIEELAGPLTAMLGSYAEATALAELSYRLEPGRWPELWRDGQVVDRYELPIDLVAGLELDLYEQVIERAEGVLVHAGAVAGARGEALVVCGRSGAGKSTLVRGLLARGYAYLTEECVALRAGGTCAGLARALHVADDAVAVPAGFRAEPYPLRGLAGPAPRLFHPPESAMWRHPARVRAILAIDHAPGADEMTPLGGGEALAELWPLLFRRDRLAMDEAAEVLGDAPRYRMRTSRPERALERVLALAAELDVLPA